MTQETKQERVITPAENSAVPTETTYPAQGRAERKKAILELTDAELQLVNGGAGKGGIGGEF